MLLSELHRAKERRPFRPFRLRLADGSSHDVARPELLVVGLGFVLVGTAHQNDPLVWARSVRLDAAEIERAEDLPPPR